MTQKPKRKIISGKSFAFTVLAFIGALALAAAVDDYRFWLRYAARVPAIIGVPDTGSANSIPDIRAVIAGNNGPPLVKCPPQKSVDLSMDKADQWMAAHNSSAFLVWHHDCVVHERYFEGDVATVRPAGAMAKSLMALAVGRAIKLGYIESLDQPVSDHLLEWKSDDRRDIRYRDLLTMHSGLQFYRQQASPFSDFQRIIISSDYEPYAVGLKRVTPPGEVYDYSAWTYDVLGIALARATRMPYENFVSETLSNPLKLGDMRIFVDRPGGTVHGNCCLYGRADDWLRLGAALVRESRSPELLPEGYVAEMATPSPDQPNYGMGLWLGSPYQSVREIASKHNPYPTPVKSVIKQSEPFAASDVMMFEGVNHTKVWIVPSYELVIVRFGDDSDDWDDAFIPNLIIRDMTP